MPFVKVKDGSNIFYEDWGEGNKYILISQIYIDYHASYTKELSKRGYHIIFIQMRGFGQSTDASNGNAPGSVRMNDVLDVADALGIDKFVYTGISHGSGVGWSIMREHPERLAAFAGVVCGPKLKDNHPTSFSWRELDVARGKTDEGWKERCEEGCQNILNQIRPYHSEYWAEEIRKFAEDDYNTQMGLDRNERVKTLGKPGKDPLDTEAKLIEWMKTVKTPTIIFGGMQDPIVIPDAMIRTAKYVPNCKLVMYQDCNHGVSIAHGDDLADDMDNFFKRHNVFG